MLFETLANATDLDAWSNRLDAQGVLPKLLLRLTYATTEGIEHIEFPSEEATQIGGWDGIVKVTIGNEFIPDGQSGWEIGTNRDIKGKADSDYEKRKADPLGLVPTDTTFVFVTPRRWGGKDKWVKARRAEGFWSDVRAYDADDLAVWLESAPGVHLWLSILIGKHPEGATDERQIAERYQGYANQVGDRWPRTAAMLRRIARSYISDARREDINAELTEDLGR